MEDDFLDAMSADRTIDDSFRGKSEEKPFEFGIRLEIDNFSKVPIDEKILSPPCIVHNLAWRIMIKRTEQCGKSRLGYFLVCDPDETKVKNSWSCEASARLYIINRDDPIDHFTREIRHLFCSKENDWGFTTFCYWDYLSDPRNKYVLNDSVKFDVCIVVDRPEGIDVSYDNFVNVKKHLKKPLKDQNIQIKNESENHLLTSIKRIKCDVMTEVDALASNLRSEMKMLKLDLMKSFADQLKTALQEIQPRNPVETAPFDLCGPGPQSTISPKSSELVPLKINCSVGSELENATVVPHSKIGSTVHWFGPSRRLPICVYEDDEVEEKLLQLSIEERKINNAVSRENEKEVSNETNEKKRKVEKTIEQDTNGEAKKNKTTSVDTVFGDDLEISDASTDDFEIISINDGDSFTSDEKPNSSLETVARNNLDSQESCAIEEVVKTDSCAPKDVVKTESVDYAATKNSIGIVETCESMAAECSRTMEQDDYTHKVKEKLKNMGLI